MKSRWKEVLIEEGFRVVVLVSVIVTYALLLLFVL